MSAHSEKELISINECIIRYTKNDRVFDALGPVSLQIRKSQFVAIVGASGCGKSTLLKLISRIVEPSSGSIELHDSLKDKKLLNIGYVFQDASLLPWASIKDNVLLPARLRGLPVAQYEDRVDKLLKTTGLSTFKDSKPAALSGGMKQRVSICRALLLSPSLLLMDEPFGALDALTREIMADNLLEIKSKENNTIVFVTHSVPEAVYLADRVIVMGGPPGKIVDDIDISFDVPRGKNLYNDSKFLDYCQSIRQSLTPSISLK